MKYLIDKLKEEHRLNADEWKSVIEDDSANEYLFSLADELRKSIYGTDVYIRGLIEISSFCKNNCYYCGIRNENKKAERYRLSEEEILSCCATGYELGFRTFVLQGGEDAYFSPEYVEELVKSIKALYPDCAITLSLGEHDYNTYKRWYTAGADRYLLRHETADQRHYEKIHPASMQFENRMQCLNNLKQIGYQVGCGFMVGSPYQNVECQVRDMQFISEFQPHMVGIGPFIPHKDTPFGEYDAGILEATLKFIALIRLTVPYALIPATTALGTIHPRGREMGLQVGANVVMPNLSPKDVRKKYSLYDNKICTGEEAAECIKCLEMRVKSVGYQIVVDRGDYKNRSVSDLIG